LPLLPRDVIRSLNNRPIASLQDVREAIKRSTRGAAMTLQIQREERLMYVTFLFE
jgi:S1-C subfamily serine protease